MHSYSVTRLTSVPVKIQVINYEMQVYKEEAEMYRVEKSEEVGGVLLYTFVRTIQYEIKSFEF